jgi:hypothetical protein
MAAAEEHMANAIRHLGDLRTELNAALQHVPQPGQTELEVAAKEAEAALHDANKHLTALCGKVGDTVRALWNLCVH